MVIAISALLDLLNQWKNRVLMIAQAALPEHQFKTFKTLFFYEFGQKRLEGELARLLAETRHQGSERNGRE